MLYWLVDLSDKLSVLNVFRYITFRTGGAVITALFFVFLFGQQIIDRLRLLQGNQIPADARLPSVRVRRIPGRRRLGHRHGLFVDRRFATAGWPHGRSTSAHDRHRRIGRGLPDAGQAGEHRR